MCKKFLTMLILGVALMATGCSANSQAMKSLDSEKQIEEDEIALSGDADSEYNDCKGDESEDETVPEEAEETYDEKVKDLVKEAEFDEYYEIDTTYYINHVSECTFDYETGQTMSGEDWIEIYIYDWDVRVWICDGIYEVESIDEAEAQNTSAEFINSMIEINGQQIFANDSRYAQLLAYAVNYNNVMSNMGATSVFYNESYKGVIAEYTLDGYTIWFYGYRSWAMVQISN